MKTEIVSDREDMSSESTRAVKPIRSILECHFDVVNGCQLTCVGCPNSTLHPKVQRISEETFATCLGNIDVKVISLLRLFNYGEPLLHDRLPDLVKLIPQQRWRVREVEISTNAQFVDWDMVEQIIRLRILTRLVVSCDGDDCGIRRQVRNRNRSAVALWTGRPTVAAAGSVRSFVCLFARARVCGLVLLGWCASCLLAWGLCKDTSRRCFRLLYLRRWRMRRLMSA